MNKKVIVAASFLAFVGCTQAPRLKQDSSGNPTVSNEFAIKSPASGPKREKIPAVEAAVPSRSLDTGDPTGGRLTLVEMHRMAMRENESLKSEMRAKDQQIAEVDSAREAFRARSVELDNEVKKMRQGFDEMSKENQDLKSQLIEAAIRVAELEKQVLQAKIDSLKTRKPAAKPAEPKTEPKTEKKPEAREEGEGEKKEPKVHH